MPRIGSLRPASMLLRLPRLPMASNEKACCPTTSRNCSRARARFYDACITVFFVMAFMCSAELRWIPPADCLSVTSGAAVCRAGL
jgi:hypothetical protein